MAYVGRFTGVRGGWIQCVASDWNARMRTKWVGYCNQRVDGSWFLLLNELIRPEKESKVFIQRKISFWLQKYTGSRTTPKRSGEAEPNSIDCIWHDTNFHSSKWIANPRWLKISKQLCLMNVSHQKKRFTVFDVLIRHQKRRTFPMLNRIGVFQSLLQIKVAKFRYSALRQDN